MNRYLSKQINKLIPGGAHTYSRGDDQFSSNTPALFKRGKGAYLFDLKENKYLDYGMALRAINIGYDEEKISAAAINEIKKGNNLTRASMTELKAAEKFTSLIKSADMVKFAKNGSSAVTAAVKLARAYTGKEIILRCANHPFFSYDDWFIGSTVIKKGVTKSTINDTKLFKYNDIESVKKLVKKYKNKIACIVLEASTTECPTYRDKNVPCCGKKRCELKGKKNFLKEIEQICKNNEIVFILDEMITGFRWDLQGAQNFYNVKPDLSTFGKAMSNGYSIAAVCGSRKIMEYGSIKKNNQERVFLMSTTYGGEMSSFGAFLETIKFMKKNRVIEKNWNYGKKLKNEMNLIFKKYNIYDDINVSGINCAPILNFYNQDKSISFELKTYFQQEMIKHKILMPWISLCYNHKEKEFLKTINAVEKVSFLINKALKYGIKSYIKGPIVKSVFRRFN